MLPRTLDITLLAIGLLTTTIACGPAGFDDGGETDGETDSETGDDNPCPPQAPMQLELGFAPVKQFEFSWAEATGATYYQLLESADGQLPFVQVGDDLVGVTTTLTVPLHARMNARYMLRACNEFGCTDSQIVDVAGTLAGAIGYFKASNTSASNFFGAALALSGDGSTLAVGAHREASDAIGIDGDQTNAGGDEIGAVYVYTRDAMDVWTQQAYVKPLHPVDYDSFGASVALSEDGSTLVVGSHGESTIGGGAAGAVYVYTRDAMDVWTPQAHLESSNPDWFQYFGASVAVSGDGSTLAVGANGERSNAVGIDGDQTDRSAMDAGAVYVYTRDAMNVWTQQAYVKASNTDERDEFGIGVALSGDGGILAVGAYREDSHATGIDGDQTDNSAAEAGAVYVYERDAMDIWTQRAYLKASNTDAGDEFGHRVVLSEDGSTLAVGSDGEASHAIIDGDQADNSVDSAGAVYVYTRDAMHVWTQQAYVKASNTDASDRFGSSVALSKDGSTLAVGATEEGSSAIGIDGDQTDNSAGTAGAVYVYTRDAMDVWTPQAYVKASNTEASDYFGVSVAVSGDGSILAVGAFAEDSNAVGVGGDQTDNSAEIAGAVYLY